MRTVIFALLTAGLVFQHTPASAQRSDDFSAAELDDGLWTVVDPIGGGSVDQVDGQLILSVPAGAPRDLWSDGNGALRLVQRIDDSDFELETKFESVPSEAGQTQGIFVQAGPDDYLRFDYYHDGSDLRIVAASIDAFASTARGNATIRTTSPELWLRMRRAGDRWELSHSQNGSDWTPAFEFRYRIPVEHGGVYVANADPGPAFVGIVDYFFDTTAPIVPEDGSLLNDPPVATVTVPVDGSQITTGDPVVLAADASDSDGTVSSVDFLVDGSLVGTDTASPWETTWTPAAPATYEITARAVDDAGDSTTSAPVTVTAVDPPGGLLVSDDFSAAVLDSAVWTVVDPLGDGSAVQTGGRLRLTVPGGSAHDLWLSGNEALRAVQPVPDPTADFQVEAKFESVPTMAYQVQGILAEESPGNYLRFDTYHNGVNLRLFLAHMRNDLPTVLQNIVLPAGLDTVWLRLTRTGPDYTFEYSVDGQSFTAVGTYPVAVEPALAGVYAGNAGSNAPEYTAAVDYFFDTATPIDPEDGDLQVDTTPPVISGETATPTSDAVAFSWSTDEPTTGEVAYGRTSGLELGTLSSPLLRLDHAVDFVGLQPDTEYFWQITATDEPGNVAQSPVSSFTTPPLDSLPAVLVSDDFSSAGLDTTLWTVVDPLGDGTVTQSGGLLELSVPGGVEHDLWVNGNESLRVVQPVTGNSFEVETKFESIPTEAFQIQGILLEQATGTYLRFDAYSDGTEVRLYAASFADDVPSVLLDTPVSGVTDTIWLRIRRVDASHTLSYSVDGTTFVSVGTFDLSVTPTLAGVYAANSGPGAPAHTAVVDYFFDTAAPIDPEDDGIFQDTTPPVITDFAVVTDSTAADVSWSTDEATTGEVAYGLTSTLELGSVVSPTLQTGHAVQLSDLLPDTTYFWQITATDEAGNGKQTPVGQFFTAPGDTITPSPLVSDDFSDGALDTDLWTTIDPLGDGTVVQASGRLELSIPGGVAHDLWTNGNESLRVVQSASDTDFEIEVKFESLPTDAFQIQGILVEESPGNYIRFDNYSDGSELRVLAATFDADTPDIRGDTAVVGGTGVIWLRLRRQGTDWECLQSADGEIWNSLFSFSSSLTPSLAGVYVANAGTSPPAYETVVDYFFDTAAPIVPEDENVVDTVAPQIGDVQIATDPTAGTATVTCVTDEPSTAVIDYGPDPSYGQQLASPTVSTEHTFEITGLGGAGTVYNFSITATDTLGNSGSTPDDTFQMAPPDAPSLVVWHGLDQRVGHLGPAQPDFNVMGNVSPIDDLVSLTYSLNSAPPDTLNWGAGADGFGDSRRLAATGDFNADIAISRLQSGPNTVELRAENDLGNVTTVTVNVDLQTGSSPLPYSVDWGGVTDPQDVGQYVDGQWFQDGIGLRTQRVGYDRIFLIGEESWQDYEILTPITLHSVEDGSSVSGPSGLGFLMRFTGHVVGGHRNWPDAQPKWGYQPFGAIGWLRWEDGPTQRPTLQFYRGDRDQMIDHGLARETGEEEILEFGSPLAPTLDFGQMAVEPGQTSWMRMRCETLPDAPDGDGVTVYSFKIWAEGETEPVDWSWEVVQTSEFALRAGGVGLLAHNVDATFGDVVVTPLAPAATLAGDVDRNGDLEIADAALVLDQLVGAASLGGVPSALGDLNGSGELDAQDAALISELAVTGRIDRSDPRFERSAPSSASWKASPGPDGRLDLSLDIEDIAGEGLRSLVLQLEAPGLARIVRDVTVTTGTAGVSRWHAEGDQVRVALAAPAVADGARPVTLSLDTRDLTEAVMLEGELAVDGGSSTVLPEQALTVVPVRFALDQNWPNPFNPSTTIAFDLPRDSRVRLVIYDLRGREVRRLVDGELPFGSHTVTWPGTDDTGRRVASGVYLFRLDAPGFTDVRKMTLVK
ncbi:MAG TPA: Ig-like domain-containing protein [Candidatus Krumholzibacteria bacterium]|nr:Ig-like domain-containing protein [Candidatus Krumholzibacteria bacterium]